MDDPIGKITPVGPFIGDPIAEFGRLVAFGIKMAILAAGIILLIFLIWGAIDWLMSGGEKEKLSKAQQKLTQAIIGIILVIVVITLWTVITGNVLGIIEIMPDGSWGFRIPTL